MPVKLDSTTCKLLQANPLDAEYLMLYIRDGKVEYRDDATGPSAYQGHDYAEGDDCLVAYGDELDVKAAQNTKTWTIRSAEDPAYGTEGKAPLAVFRKSKPNNADFYWNVRLDHWLFLKLPSPLQQDSVYTVSNTSITGLNAVHRSFSFDWTRTLSEAIHVCLTGYEPDAAIKPADLYSWLGDGGSRDYSSFEGKPVYLVDETTAERFVAGRVAFWKESQPEMEGYNLTGSPVWQIDFTHFNRTGTYRLAIEGIGASQPFPISNEVFLEPYRTSLRGFYYMRIGEPVSDLRPVPRQPRFIPGKDPDGFTIHLTDLHPWHPDFIAYPQDTWDEPHHVARAEDSIFWRHRLPGNPINEEAVGGHADAFDWDRHLAHVSIIYDMLLPFLLSKGRLTEDNLDIRESGNGIPDLLDEARNEVDFWLTLRDGEGYCQGLTNPCKALKHMFQAGRTAMAAWANAVNCAMMADAFRLNGRQDLASRYASEAIKAFRVAEAERDQQLDAIQNVGDTYLRGRDFKVTAAAFLYNVTGERQWEDILAEETVIQSAESALESGAEWGETEIEDGSPRWCQLYAVVAYLTCPHPRHYANLHEDMKAVVFREAREKQLSLQHQRPSRRTTIDSHWQTVENVHRLLIAHSLCQDPDLRRELERGMLLEASWGLGRNPSNMVEMTGLGPRCVVNCYTSGRNDGSPGLHPGHTPYWNLDPWSIAHTGADPTWFTKQCYPEWQSGWPHQEGHFDNRYSYANAEFTPQQTMRGKMALLAYCYAIRSDQ